jgi:tetratricopeptide (TPR) repeat protein
MRPARVPVTFRLAGIVLLAVGLADCAVLKRAAINSVASALSSGSGDTFTRDDDPELVRDASAFALKLYETLLESVPKNQELLVEACGAFTQYGYAFVQTDAIVLGDAQHHEEVVALNQRALNLYIRAKGYCMRAMELRFPGIQRALLMEDTRDAILKRAARKDVKMLYWTAASWGAAISLGVDRPELVIDLPVVRALAARALALDETFQNGAIHEMLISLDSVSEAIGGSAERARAHFKRAVEIQKGASPGPYVSLAMGVALPAQNREEFLQLLEQALAIDPEKDPSSRLVTLITQKRATALRARVDTLFAR